MTSKPRFYQQRWRWALMSGLVLALILRLTLADFGTAQAAPTCTQANGVTTCTFTNSRAPETWTVPAGVSEVTFDLYGASGAGDGAGAGGRVLAILPTTPGTVYQIRVGGMNGYNGGGSVDSRASGGGASDVRSGAFGLADRLLVAGGGGGAGRDGSIVYAGGAGGYPSGAAGLGRDVGMSLETLAGKGGTQSEGGDGGRFPVSTSLTKDGIPGALGQGGDGGEFYFSGGGGGGYYGGGGGAGSTAGNTKGFFAGGGGGSSYATSSAALVSFENGVRQGNGLVIIRYTTGYVETRTFTGGSATWTVPAGVSEVTFDLYGAAGAGDRAGAGGRVLAILPTTPGTVYQIRVGGMNGYNGGGSGGLRVGTRTNGGGATDVRIGAFGLADRLLVAGGGGGGGRSDLWVYAGGAGGYPSGADGDDGNPTRMSTIYAGRGGTQSGGGAGGILDNGDDGVDHWGNAGQLGQGGDSAQTWLDSDLYSGGGGGGYYGGGGGAAGAPGDYGGGGGGSSYATGSAAVVSFANGVRQGDGLVIIRYPSLSAPATSIPPTPTPAAPTPTPLPPTATPMPPTPTPLPPTATPTAAVAPLTGGGEFSSLALDSSGRPVISYYDRTSQDLKVLKCGNAPCSSGNTGAIVDSAGDLGQYTALKLDSSGKPVISYYDQTNGNLKLAHCGNADCTGGNVLWTVDNNPGNVGLYTSLALDSSGYPVISYWDLTNRDLKLVHCGNATCTAGGTIWTVDSLGAAGMHNALALNSSGNPVMSYLDESNFDLRLVYCGNPSCTAGGGFQTIDTAGTVGLFTSLALDSSGKPVISYYDDTNGDLKVLTCGNTTCTTGNSSRIVDGVGSAVGKYTSLALDSSGKPVISYYDVTNRDLKVVYCGNLTCSSGNTIRTVDSAGDVGQHTSLKLDSGGNAVISYYDFTNNKLKLARVGAPGAAGGVAASAVASEPDAVAPAQPLTTTEVAAVPVVAETTVLTSTQPLSPTVAGHPVTAEQRQQLFLPLVANNAVSIASDAGVQSAALAATAIPTATAPVVETVVVTAVVTPSQALSPVATPVEMAPVVSESVPVSVPVEVGAVVTESVPTSMPMEVAPVVSESVPVSAPVAVDAAAGVTNTPAMTTTQTVITADANVAPGAANVPVSSDASEQSGSLFLPLINNTNALAGTALGAPGAVNVLVLVGLVVVGGAVWRFRRQPRRY